MLQYRMQFLYFIGVLLSSSFEMYNYMLFPFVESIIMPDFYKGDLQIGFLILFISSFVRPFSSLFFGYIGDLYDRRFALLLSMSLMGFSSLLIVFLPQYSLIGNYAILGVILVRVMQVASISGEHAGVAISLIEFIKKDKEYIAKKAGLASGLVYFFSMFGVFIVTCVKTKLTKYNWHYAYYISFILVLCCFILRLLPYKKVEIVQKNQEKEDFYKNFCACFLISASMSALYYFNTVFVLHYFHQHQIDIAIFSMIYLLIYMFATLFFGYISDFFQKLYLFIVIPCVLLFFNLGVVLYYCNPYLHCLNIVFLAMYAGPSHAVFFRLFVKKNRYRGISVAYSLGSSLIGSSAPLVAACITDFSGFMIYLFFILSLPLLGVAFSYKNLR